MLVVTVSFRILHNSSNLRKTLGREDFLFDVLFCSLFFFVWVTRLDKDIKSHADPKIYCCYLSTFIENNGSKWGVTRILYMKSSDCNKLMKYSIKISSEWTNIPVLSLQFLRRMRWIALLLKKELWISLICLIFEQFTFWIWNQILTGW